MSSTLNRSFKSRKRGKEATSAWDRKDKMKIMAPIYLVTRHHCAQFRRIR